MRLIVTIASSFLLACATSGVSQQPSAPSNSAAAVRLPDTSGFDSRERRRASVTLIPPGRFPKALIDSLGTVMATLPGIERGPYVRDIVIIRFRPETPLPARQAAIDSVRGLVVGGFLDPEGRDGSYYVRISGGTFDALVQAVNTLFRQPQVGYASWWELFTPDIQSTHRPDNA